jgi:hypothetical protein
MKRRFDAKIAVNVFLICLLSLLMVSVDSAFGKKIAGVDVPQSVTIENKALVLNGAGIRKKLFIKVYVGSLYLKEVSKKRTVAGWNKGFADNSSAKEIMVLQERINQFNSLFTTVYKGDEIRLDYVPGDGTQVRINGTLKGSVSGEDFYQALLKIWLGSNPADANLKDAMLGNSY